MLENFMTKESSDALTTIMECFELETTMEAINLCRQNDMSIVTEGTNIETLKEFFGENVDDAKRTIKQANKRYSSADYKGAKDLYETGLKMITASKDKIVGLPNNVGSTLLTWIIPYINLANALIMLNGTLTTFKPTSAKDMMDAVDETMSWNVIKASAVGSLIRIEKWCKVRIKQCDAELKKYASNR